MHNLVYLIGRLTNEPIITKIEGIGDMGKITLAVTRSYKNEEGQYDVDFLDCILWNGIANHVAEYCHKGDLVGLKGRVQTRQYETEDGSKHKIIEIVAEKVTFLSSNTKDIKENGNVKVSEE